MTIQDQINALPPAGGKIILPVGDFTAESPLIMARDCVIIEGQGEGTKIPPVKGAGTQRVENLILRDLTVCASPTCGYAIDFRNVSAVQINNVFARNCTYGLVLDYAAYYAVVTSLFIEASVCAVEAYGGGNQNTFIGGRWTAPLGINVTGSNGITLLGTSIEGPNVINFAQGVDPANSVKFVNVRQERSGVSPFGPVWLNN